MSWVDILGYSAAATVLATFCTSTMIPLRILALVSNVLFCSYGYFDHLYPVLTLHAALFPINLLRLVQLVTSAATEAARAGLPDLNNTGRSFQPRAMEAFMRGIAVAVITIAVLAVGGFTLRHTMQSATAASPEQARAQIGPHAVPLTIHNKSLRDQSIPGDLLGGPPYP